MMEAESLSCIRDLLIANGIIRAKGDQLTNLAVTVKPSLFPAESYQQAVRLQPHFNKLLDDISTDSTMMNETFGRISKYDAFVESLYKIFLEVQMKGNVQTTCLGIHRSDYLIDKCGKADAVKIQLKQVEINTIAAGLVAQSTSLAQVHKYVIDRYFGDDTVLKQGQVPECKSLWKVMDAMALAHKEYRNQNAYVLFVVIANEWNRFDQRQMEYDLWKRHNIRVIRRTLREIAEEGKLDDERKLFIGSKEISVCYYRAGDGPRHYPTDKEWEARKMMELSRASNCPSIAYQLVGMKKIQQILTEEGMLERYCTDSEAVSEMKSTFVQQYSIQKSDSGDKNIQMILENPARYVLKPQREGGGNNLFGEDIKTLLSTQMDTSERETYTAMDYINSPSLPNTILKSEEAEETVINSELGIFGVFVRRGSSILMNDEAGYLLRSKPEYENEGGVGTAVAAVDSPLLVSKEVYLQNIIT